MLGDINKDNLTKSLLKIKLNSDKALNMSILATKADVGSDIEDKNTNIPTFISEYLKDMVEDSNGEIQINLPSKPINFEKKINILGLTVVLDNLVSNSQKWGARNLQVEFEATANKLKVLFSDDGEGVSPKFLANPEVMFELGIKDSPKDTLSIGGSGIGLYHVRSLMNEMKTVNATIKFLGNQVALKGATFEMEFS